MASSSIPEIDRRLREERGALFERAQALRGRLRRMAPGRQARRHPEAALVAASSAGLIAGWLAGRVAHRFLR
jgi:hypothetical protein